MRPSPSRPKNSARLSAESLGRRGEQLAAWFLRAQLYRILATRFKTPIGEIDLVAQRFGVTVFVEVKARQRRAGLGEAMGAVNQRRVVRAAQYYLARHPRLAATPLRFDVIFLAPMSWPRHVKNAFDAGQDR